MNFLHQLLQAAHLEHQQAQQPQQQPGGGGGGGGWGPAPSFAMQPQGKPEDSGLVPGQQGYAPMNSDVGHFAMRPMGMPEDSGLLNGPQGYGPMNSDVGHLNGFMQPFGMSPEDAYTAQTAAQPVNYNNGQVSLHGNYLQGAINAPQYPARQFRIR